MDGNGRWASRRGLARTEGHAAGEEALLDAVEGALEIGVKWLTMFAFSTENWRRPHDEVRYLMGFNESLLMRRRDELNDKGVRIRFAGRRDWRVPRRVLRRMDESVELTRANTRMTLTMAFNYGGRAEIVDAVRPAGTPTARRPTRSTSAPSPPISTYPDLPDPDLVIRTSGEYRISNFLLWQLAYSELVFTDVLWPDFRRQDLFAAVAEFQRRERRYGGVRVTRTVKVYAWVLGVVVIGALIVLAVAGAVAAAAILVTIGAIVVMTLLGNLMGGRATPTKAPYVPGGAQSQPEPEEMQPEPEPAQPESTDGGTMGT